MLALQTFIISFWLYLILCIAIFIDFVFQIFKISLENYSLISFSDWNKYWFFPTAQIYWWIANKNYEAASIYFNRINAHMNRIRAAINQYSSELFIDILIGTNTHGFVVGMHMFFCNSILFATAFRCTHSFVIRSYPSIEIIKLCNNMEHMCAMHTIFIRMYVQMDIWSEVKIESKML